jgi:tetratricopeptide (TPR) repeat protein
VIRRGDEPKLTTPTIVGHQRVSPPRAEPPRGDDDTMSWDPAEAAPGTPPEPIGPGEQSGPTPLLRRVAQFVLLERLGAGGMGVVFAAFDEKLERKVAIKLVATQGSDERAHQRLLREAQAQGRLSHPNVVTVYEVGTLPEGRLFIAMELVKGQTLRGWQQSGARSWQDIVARYAAAGDGLAAAHRAGIVHRDFKPDNVLVGDDGRVRVADFGLAFAAEAALPPPDPSEPPSGERSRPALTAVGAVLGTPGYMAPEQFAGGAVDARTDQFSFCVAHYEALHGERPNADLAFANGARPPLRRSEPDPTYPRWLWDALMRGLAHAPAARFPSMDALLAELRRSRARIRRRVGFAVGLVGVLATAGIASAALLGSRAPEPCPLPTGELAGVWDAVTKQRVQAALLGTGTPFAANVWASTQAAFDRYASHWVDAQQAACEATHVRHVQSAELLDRRVECLTGRRRSLAAATEILQSRPAQAVAHAGEILSSLGDIDLCADTGVLLELGPRVGDASAGTVASLANVPTQAQVAAVRGSLARASALLATGDVAAAEPAVAEANRLAKDLDNNPVRAEIRYLEGKLKLARGDVAESITSFNEAVELAVTSHHDELQADAWLSLATDAGVRDQRPAEIERWLGQGEAWLRRLGHTNDPRRILVQRARAQLQLTAGNPSQALITVSQAIEAAERLWGKEDPQLISLLHERALVHASLRHAKPAVSDGERALALGIASWGSDYPDIAKTRRLLGLLYIEQLGAVERGEQQLNLALKLYSAQLGLDSIEVASCEQALSQAGQFRGDYAAALPHAERAEKIFAKQLGSDHPRHGEALMGLGVVRFMRRDLVGSLEAYEAAYPILRTAWGANHYTVGILLSNTGETLLALGRAEPAAGDFTRALEILTRSVGPEHADLALPLKGLGLAQLSQGNPRDAIAPFERALKLRTQSTAANDPQEVAEIQWGLARSLRALGRDPSRAHKLAEDAMFGYRALGSESAGHVQEILQWLANGGAPKR